VTCLGGDDDRAKPCLTAVTSGLQQGPGLPHSIDQLHEIGSVLVSPQRQRAVELQEITALFAYPYMAIFHGDGALRLKADEGIRNRIRNTRKVVAAAQTR
jgi:hypothetical protein